MRVAPASKSLIYLLAVLATVAGTVTLILDSRVLTENAETIRVESVEVGMDKAQVVHRLGAPLRAETTPSSKTTSPLESLEWRGRVRHVLFDHKGFARVVSGLPLVINEGDVIIGCHTTLEEAKHRLGAPIEEELEGGTIVLTYRLQNVVVYLFVDSDTNRVDQVSICKGR